MGGLRGYRGTNGVTSSYLRGAKVQVNKKPTLQNKVAKIERQISKLKPEVIQHINNENIVSTGFGTKVVTLDCTRDLIDWTEFRDKITGDRWYNKGLQFRIMSVSSNVSAIRVVVYVPARPSAVFSPTAGYQLVEVPGQVPFKVLSDHLVTSDVNQFSFMTNYISLGNSLTEYNSTANIIDKNHVKIAVIWDSTSSASTLDLICSYSHLVTNK